nr:hypothetical protein CFP56_30802 [Quercus suber]
MGNAGDDYKRRRKHDQVTDWPLKIKQFVIVHLTNGLITNIAYYFLAPYWFWSGRSATLSRVKLSLHSRPQTDSSCEAQAIPRYRGTDDYGLSQSHMEAGQHSRVDNHAHAQ